MESGHSILDISGRQLLSRSMCNWNSRSSSAPIGQVVYGSTRQSRERCGRSSEWYWEQSCASGVPPAYVDVVRSQKYSFLQPTLPPFTPACTHRKRRPPRQRLSSYALFGNPSTVAAPCKQLILGRSEFPRKRATARENAGRRKSSIVFPSTGHPISRQYAIRRNLHNRSLEMAQIRYRHNCSALNRRGQSNPIDGEIVC